LSELFARFWYGTALENVVEQAQVLWKQAEGSK
jgi:hypothetical protein